MPQKLNIQAYRTLEELKSLQTLWEELRARERKFFPSFQDTEMSLRESGAQFCAFALGVGDSIQAIACFVSDQGVKTFGSGKRVFLRLPVRVTTLYGQSLLGTCSPAAWRTILHLIAKEKSFDLIHLGEVEIGSPLHEAVKDLGEGLIAAPRSKNSIHWFTTLPGSFDEFLKGLRKTTRGKVTRALKTFERDCSYQFEVVSRPDQIDKFLAGGEAISRLTYQWNIGHRLQNDEATRRRYASLASSNRLRCYLLYVDEKPCAFVRGTLDGVIYAYQTPGFDPQFAKLSPGTVILMWALKDLIENTDCKIFDFGEGGDTAGYKERFGNNSYECAYVEIYNLYSPYSLAIWILHSLFESGKGAMRALVRKLSEKLAKLPSNGGRRAE